jgi:hypothetical protein
LTKYLIAKVSLDRITKFLSEAEFIDRFSDKQERFTGTTSPVVEGDQKSKDIGFRNATFSWSVEQGDNGSLTPSSRNFRLQVKGEVLFKRNCINMIVGPT